MFNHRFRTYRIAHVVVVLAVGGASAVASETAVGPVTPLPAYPDQVSAYSVAPAAYDQVQATPVLEPPPIDSPAARQPVIQAAFEAPSPTVVRAEKPRDDSRRLAPPSDHRPMLLAPRDKPRDAASVTSQFGLPVDSIYTTVTALAVVVGLFLACAWAVRRGQKKSNSMLPEDVVRVLGRVPLAARQFAELVHVGNKLVLVSVTQHGVEPLAEVTDPAEVDRLLGLCHQRQGNSTTAEFEHVFREMAQETSPAGFLGAEAPQIDARSTPDPFAAYRGGYARA